MTFKSLCVGLLAATTAATGCTTAVPTYHSSEPFSSALGTLLDFEYDGTVESNSAYNLTGQVRSQLMYTLGSMNAEPGVSQLSKAQITKLTSTAIGGGRYRIGYHIILPVAWGHKDNLPSSYTFTLPRKIDQQTTFTNKYGQSCNDGDGDSVDVDNFWYHYRPHTSGCSLADADVVSMTATVRIDSLNSTNKYPEYDKIWQDNALRIVAVFAKYAAGDKNNDDAGIEAYNNFVAAIRAELPNATTTPANLPAQPGAAITDVTFKGTLDNGGEVSVVVLLVESVPSAGSTFLTRYSQVTPGADLILYNGHAGLGANIRALTHDGTFFPDTYQIFFMNGCDSFAYLDTTLATTRAALNPSDPTGTRFMDNVTNAMPAYFNSMPDASMAFIRALENEASPLSYDQILAQVDPAQVVVVTGDEDNVFTPDYDPNISWNGFNAANVVGYAKSFSYQTDVLDPGTYVFEMLADPAHSGGDGDLRIRLGSATAAATKCQSYVRNSNERCKITLTQPEAVYMSATGDSTATASYEVAAWQE